MGECRAGQLPPLFSGPCASFLDNTLQTRNRLHKYYPRVTHQPVGREEVKGQGRGIPLLQQRAHSTPHSQGHVLDCALSGNEVGEPQTLVSCCGAV